MLTPRPGSSLGSKPDEQDITFSGDVASSGIRASDVPPPMRGIQVTATMQSHAGPLPPPAILASYGQIDASFPDRIIKMAEQNSATERRTSERAQWFQLIEGLAGRVLGATFACGALGVAAWLSINDHDAVAGVIAGTTIAGVCLALVAGKRT